MLGAMKPNVSALERAFELAATGRYRTVSDICGKLSAEGYQASQVSGPLLRKQLLGAIVKASQRQKPVSKGPKGQKRPAGLTRASE